MARAIWSGAVSFGLVNVPVKAYAAVRDHAVHFHQLRKGTGARIHNRKVTATSGVEVDADDIELGYELPSGKHVVVDPEELEALRPEQTRTIDVTDFVELEAIDPIFYVHTYWLAPADKPAARPYGLLLAAMIDRGRVGIGTVVMRNKQYLAAIRPFERGLAMSTMRFADEIVSASDIDALPTRQSKFEAKEKHLADQIIDALESDWKPERYHDTYTELLLDVIERKAKGEEIIAEAPSDESSSNVIDLMAALEASVADAQDRRGSRRTKRPRRAGAKGAPKRKRSSTTARSSSPKRAPAKHASSRSA